MLLQQSCWNEALQMTAKTYLGKANIIRMPDLGDVMSCRTHLILRSTFS